MPAAQVQAKLGGVAIPLKDELGFARLTLLDRQVEPNSARPPLFEGVREITFEFVDDRLATLRVTYKPPPDWDNEDEFLSSVKTSLNLPGRWKLFHGPPGRELSDSSNRLDELLARQITCDGFIVVAGLPIGRDQRPFIKLQNLIALRLVSDRAEEKKRRESEERKKAFKP